MFRLHNPSPMNPYGRGIGYGKVLGDEIQTHEAATRYLRAYFEGDAVPPYLITGERMDGPAARRLEAQLHRRMNGPSAIMQKLFALPGKVDVTKLDSAFAENGKSVIELKEHEHHFALQVFGIPPEVFGILMNSNRATSIEARKMLATSVLIPRTEMWREALQWKLAPLYDDNLIIDYDDPTPDDERHQLRVLARMPWLATVAEGRELAGLPPEERDTDLRAVPSGYQFVESLSNVEGPDGSDDAPISEPTGGDDGGEGSEEEPPESEPEGDEGDSVRTVQKVFGLDFTDIIDRIVELRRSFMSAVHQRALRKLEDVDLDAAVAALTASQIEAALEEFPVAAYADDFAEGWAVQAMTAGHIVHQQVAARIVEAVAPGQFIESQMELAVENWIRERGAVLVREISEKTRDGIREALIRIHSQGLADYDMRDLVKDLSETVGPTTKQVAMIEKRIQKLVDAGVSPGEIQAARVEAYRKMRLYRSRLIADTETRWAANAGLD